MKVFFSIFFIFCFISLKAQQFTVSQLIEKWSASDTSQTRLAETTYDDLSNNADTTKYKALLKELQKYINNNGSKRLQIRLCMYDIFGHEELNLPHLPEGEEKMLAAIEAASLLKDDQLLCELYALYADRRGKEKTPERALLYYEKVADMQQRIGDIHFPKAYLRYLSLSITLYRIGEFRLAIDRGLKGLALQEQYNVVMVTRLLQYDYIASAYKELHKNDSVLYYYTKAANILNHGLLDERNKKTVEIWKGVISGGIGQAYFLQGKYDDAIPLLTKNISSSVQYAQWADASLAQNTLADIYYNKHHYSSALSGWRNAFNWALKDKDYKNIIRAVAALSNTYRYLNKQDSAWRYFDLYTLYKDSLNSQMKANFLSQVKAQIAFDALQYSLKSSHEQFIREKYLRYTIVAGVILIAIFTMLVYNRKRLAQKMHLQTLEQKNKDAALAIQQAAVQIENFRKSIVEKNKLINSLQRDNEQESDSIYDKLMGYVFIKEEEWVKFKTEFSRALPEFLPKLHKQLNGASPAEEKLAALISLKLDNYQIANTLGIGKESVARSKRRLKQRLGLAAEVDLETYIIQL